LFVLAQVAFCGRKKGSQAKTSQEKEVILIESVSKEGKMSKVILTESPSTPQATGPLWLRDGIPWYE